MGAALLLGSSPAVASPPPAVVPVDAPRLERAAEATTDAAVGSADISAPNFAEQVVISGLVQPIVTEFAPDGRVFVGEKSGIIKEYDSIDDQTATIYADLSTNVHDYWDRGLLGLALDPNFMTNDRMYVAYTYNAPIGGTAPVWQDGNCEDPPGANTDGCVVSGRLSVLTNGGSEQVLINDWCQQFPSHSMSDIVFDDEGALLVNGGDGANFNASDYGQYGGSPGSPIPKNPCGDPPAGVGGTMTLPSAEGGGLRAQDIRTTSDPVGLNGTVIRIDRFTGAPMAGNPTTIGSTNEQRIIAYGLRNPFRMAIHPDSGELWIGDVGWGTWEEINRHGDPEGPVRNYGWPCREGNDPVTTLYSTATLCTSLSTWRNPTFTYDHTNDVAPGGNCGGGGSISGMAFYEGGPYPDIYDNALFFADYSRTCLWVMPADGSGVPDPSRVEHFADVSSPVHLTVGPGGDIFYTNLISGTVRRLVYLFDNSQPTADAEAAPLAGPLPLAVNFDATDSSDPDDDPLMYAWDFGDDDGEFDDAFGATPSHSYTEAGTFHARVRVDDGRNGTAIAEVVIDAGNAPPTAHITQPLTGFTWSVDQTVSFAGTGSDPNQGNLPASAKTWEVIMAHCPSACHEHPLGIFNDVSSGTFTAPDHEYPSHIILRLTVEDQFGATDTDEIILQPKTVDLQIRSAPSGMSINAGWVTKVTPFTLRAIRGSAILLGAPSSLVIDGFPYTWESWSDGGARTHTVTPTVSGTYTSTYDGVFDDVPPGARFGPDIAWLWSNGITAGCAPDLFCPDGLVTRGQMATFLTRALDLPSTGADFFTDDETNKHEASINRLAAAGITVGCAPGRFCPDGIVTRAQMATFLARAFDLPPTATDFFTDDETSVHEARINRLAAADITHGCTATTFCPNGAVTRRQMAAFLHRAMGD
jgi:glucose/arabinose dehydrogenase